MAQAERNNRQASDRLSRRIEGERGGGGGGGERIDRDGRQNDAWSNNIERKCDAPIRKFRKSPTSGRKQMKSKGIGRNENYYRTMQ